MIPIVRVAALGAGAMGLLLVAAGAAYYVVHRTADPPRTGSRVASLPPTRTSLPGDRLAPDSQQAYGDLERQSRQVAEQKPGAAASVPPMDTLDPIDPIHPPTPRPGEVATWERQRQEQARQQEQQQAHAKTQKAQGMAKVLAAWNGAHATVNAGLPPEKPEPKALAATLPDPGANFPVDKIYYGLLRVYLSSDEPGPVVVGLKDGALNGARLIGSFKRADEKVVIHFDRMTFQGAWYTVDAYAIDPETGRLGLATDVDRRTFTRWAALLGSAILQGAQRAYLSQGTQSSYLWGQTTTNAFDDREILGIALGEIGARTRQTATDYFNRPPTVYVNPGLQLVGVLFMGPPSRNHEGQPRLAAIASPQPPPTVTSDLLRAATAATLASPSENTHTAPSENTQNDARSPAAWASVAPLQPAPADE
jgi:type IV secretory pathway VirB10-like protein